MSSEKLASAPRTELAVCQPNTTVSSTVTTKRNQQVYTQQTYNITRHIRKVSPAIDSNNSSENQSLVPIDDMKKMNLDVKRTTKTYCRRIIRKIGPNGEVSEEIIEEGDSMPIDFFQQNQPALENSNIAAITAGPNEDLSKQILSSGTKFQATAGFNTVSETGEKRSLQMSTGPMEFPFNSSGNKMGALEYNNNGQDSGENNQLALVNNSNNAVQQVMPDGSIVTRKFYGEQTATVTHSSTINGQTQTSSKSAFMSFSGESILEAKSSINDMEMIFERMMGEIKGDSFNIFNKFISAPGNSMVDHLALAGGDMEVSLIDPPRLSKPLGLPEPMCKALPILPAPKEISTEQQEEALIQKQIKIIKDSKASNRLYWSNMEEVKSSGILKNMTKEEIHFQEAIFEVITSEASYNISLDTLIEFYYSSELLNPNKPDSIINAVDKHHLFSNILLIKGVSFNLLKDLENRWSQQKPKVVDLSDIILKHAEEKNFQQQYINYLTNQSYQISCLRSLLQKENFKQALISIQSNPQCCKLSLDSFLALPMQRLTRLKLLIEVIMKLMHQSEAFFQKIPKSTVENCQKALKKLKELLTDSENNKYKMEQKARLMDLIKILDFGSVKNVAIGSKELIKEGEVKASASQISSNALKKLSKKRQPTFYLIVLNDLVIITKKKSQTKLVVLDYCEKNKVDASVAPNSVNLNVAPKISRSSSGSLTSMSSQISNSSTDTISQTNVAYSFILRFKRENDALVAEPLVLTTSTIDSRDQWISAITTK